MRATLLDPTRNRRRYRGDNILIGVLFCRLCGTKLLSQPKATYRNYACRNNPAADWHGCGRVHHRADWIESFVAEAVLTRLEDPELVRAWHEARLRADTKTEDLFGKLAALDAREDELCDGHYKEKKIDQRQFDRQMAALRDERAALERRASSSAVASTLAPVLASEDVRAAFQGLGPDEKRSVIASVVDQVRVGSAVKGRNKFDPSRIEMDFAGS